MTTLSAVKNLRITLVALVFGSRLCHAEIGANEVAGDLHVKFGVIHGLGELVGTGLGADGEGFQVGLGYHYTDELSLNTRYEMADFDIYQDFRLTLDRKIDLTSELSLHVLGGYAWQNLLRRTVETDGIIANAGLCWERGSWFFGANYSRVFALHTSSNAMSIEGQPLDLPEKHTDLFEVIAGYRLGKHASLVLSYERQFGGDTAIQIKKHVVLAVRLKL